MSHFETRREAALLACLALRPGRPQRREALARELWPDEDWEVTRSRLRQVLSLLRRDLEDRDGGPGLIIADREAIYLDGDLLTTDVDDFRSGIRAALSCPETAGRVRALKRAVELYGGELAPGYQEECLLRERDHLAEAYRRALLELSRLEAEAGGLEEAIEWARRAILADPLQEESHSLLMRHYRAAGRAADVVRQYRDLERILRAELGAVPSPATRELLHCADERVPPRSATVPPPRQPLEPEGGAVPLDSCFYMERPADRTFEEAISRRDSIVLVRGARQTGKSSLLARGLRQAREEGARVVLTDFQKIAPAQLDSLDALFTTLAWMIADQLDLEVSPEELWHPGRGWNVNFERFLRREVLSRVPALVWGMDEIDRIFQCEFRQVVFGLFRSWHNERSLNPDGPWGKLTLAIAYATEAHLFITDLNQSPFNVGTRVLLEDFTAGEVAELNRRYGSPLGASEEAAFVALTGGQPYLVRRGLHLLVSEGLRFPELQTRAARPDGPFGDHLRQLYQALERDQPLRQVVHELLFQQIRPGPDAFQRLRSAGVLAGASAAEARVRCRLYSDYLGARLA